MAEHSPLPWRLERRTLPELVDVWLVDRDGDELATFYSNDGADEPKWLPYEDNAKFIVRAVNSHAALLASLKEAAQLVRRYGYGSDAARLETVIAAAEASEEVR